MELPVERSKSYDRREVLTRALNFRECYFILVCEPTPGDVSRTGRQQLRQ